MLSTLYEIRTHLATVTHESQINDLIDEMINLTIMEIQDPAWALKGHNHLWNSNRRASTFATVASTETYQMKRDFDKMGIIRQTASPVKLKYIPDELFYMYVPNPTATGNPRYYRLWEEFGVSTQLSSNDTISVVSSSTSDTSTFKVTIRGLDANSLDVTEVLTLNGTTTVTGSTTFSKILQVSKSGKTTGTITVKAVTATTTLCLIAPEERSPRFKRISLYPIPSSAITISYEYWTRFRQLVNNSDVLDFDEKWHWVVRQGALAKIFQYQNKETDFAQTQVLYTMGVKSMAEADIQNVDFIPVLRSQHPKYGVGMVELADDVFGLYHPYH